MSEEDKSETHESVPESLPEPEARVGFNNNYMLANNQGLNNYNQLQQLITNNNRFSQLNQMNQLSQLNKLGQSSNSQQLGTTDYDYDYDYKQINNQQLQQLANKNNRFSQLNQLNQLGQSSNRHDTSKLASTDYDYDIGSTGSASNYQQGGSNSNMLLQGQSSINKNNGGVGYLDYFDNYDSTNYAPQAQSLNMNYDVGMGLGNGMGGYSSNNNYRQKLLRRRNGLMSGQQLGNAGQSAGQLGQLGGGQLNNRADSLGLGSSGYGATGFGGGATGYGGSTGYGGGSGYGAPVSIVSGYGGGSGQCASGVNPLLALLTLAGAAVGFYFIYVKLTMSAGQRRSSNSYYVDEVADILFIGI